ncbi:hypothetical protein EYZ11_010464 [Aspergillus tanneri]|uniref:Uncharacterized protein n=1 Tax=Aspergillus tanneri TaxID=1220188 RepID=A0A4S3J7E6_9EURO|nr:hypothetical protein EYZ11_010464 [Aspergillus tanneri]
MTSIDPHRIPRTASAGKESMMAKLAPMRILLTVG